MGARTGGRGFQNWVLCVFALGEEQTWKPTESVGIYFFFPPIPSGLKVQDEIHSVSCHLISLTLFLQLLLGKHIKNLVGRKSRE